MRTALYLGKEKIKLTQADRPQVGPHDVLIKNINASICVVQTSLSFNMAPVQDTKLVLERNSVMRWYQK